MTSHLEINSIHVMQFKSKYVMSKFVLSSPHLALILLLLAAKSNCFPFFLKNYVPRQTNFRNFSDRNYL